MKPESVTIGILNHDNNIYEKYIAKSLSRLKGSYDLILKRNKRPAQAYNEIINQSKNKYIILLHADVTFSDDFIDVINQSISKYPDFGAFCCVGVSKKIFNKVKIVISDVNNQHEVLTSDSCCIVVNKEHNIKFDDKIFDEYHMYVEDYCAQVRINLGCKIYTPPTNWIWVQDYDENLIDITIIKKWFIHHSNTFSIKGARWGNWLEYKKRLDEKWGKKMPTT